MTRHDTTACDTTRIFAHNTIKWISSHICSKTKSGRHDKKLRQQNRSGSDFCRVSQRRYQENCKRNSFHRNLTWVNKYMTQEESLKSQTLPRYQFYYVKYFLTSFSFIKLDLNFWITFWY